MPTPCLLRRDWRPWAHVSWIMTRQRPLRGQADPLSWRPRRPSARALAAAGCAARRPGTRVSRSWFIDAPPKERENEMARHKLLLELEPYDKETGVLRIVIETPKGSRNKYDYDPDTDTFELAKVLPEGMNFPFDFGFVPSTLAEDGDPLDVLVLMDAPAVPGCTLKVRALGAIEARQKEKGSEWIRNDRVIALAENARVHESARRLDDLGPHVLKDIKEFFTNYNKLFDKKFECIKDVGPKRAARLIKDAQKLFRKKH